MNAFPKVVVSSTLDKAEWGELHPDPAATWLKEITRLKERPGGNINISGSAALVAWLLGQGLLDELEPVCSRSWSATASACSATSATQRA